MCGQIMLPKQGSFLNYPFIETIEDKKELFDIPNNEDQGIHFTFVQLTSSSSSSSFFSTSSNPPLIPIQYGER